MSGKDCQAAEETVCQTPPLEQGPNARSSGPEGKRALAQVKTKNRLHGTQLRCNGPQAEGRTQQLDKERAAKHAHASKREAVTHRPHSSQPHFKPCCRHADMQAGKQAGHAHAEHTRHRLHWHTQEAARRRETVTRRTSSYAATDGGRKDAADGPPTTPPLHKGSKRVEEEAVRAA